MAVSIATKDSIRLLGLGNEILADDAFGILVAREARHRYGPGFDVVCSSASGFHLMDELLGVRRLVVVDTLVTGSQKPGTLQVFPEKDVHWVPGETPHGMGLFEVLALARKLGLAAPEEVTIIGVEAADCITVGGEMHPDVHAAVPRALELVGRFVEGD
jgi:hydrogenase maturation protease